jgi:hypothetical protein
MSVPKLKAKEGSVGRQNYYEKVDKSDDVDRSYPNEDILKIKLPFRAIIIGSSGSGKSNLALNLISGIGIWTTITLLAKKLDEPLFKFLIKRITEMEKVQKRKILIAIDDINELPKLDDYKIEDNNLMLIDDFVADDPKALKPLNHIFLRGRKNGISPVFISQSYFDTPKIIRKNSNMVFVKSMGAKDFTRMAAEYAMGVSAKEMYSMYESTQHGNLTDFFLIDRENKDKSLIFRDGFDPIDQ